MSDSEKPKSWQERKQAIKHSWAIPFVYVEWKCEQLSKLLEKWAFLDILEHAGRLAILVAVISYIWGYPARQRQAVDQRKAKHYQAWQVIISAQGQRSSCGREYALEDLNKDYFSLAGVDISKAFIPYLYLPRADLRDANFAGAYLYHATLRSANLSGGELTRAYLNGADISSANLTGVKLYDANLAVADLLLANLTNADLQNANLTSANLNHANFAEANLADVNLSGAHLQFANLQNIKNWQKINSIELTNVHGVENSPDGFIEWAKEHGAVSMEDEEKWIRLLRERMQEKTKEK